MRVTLYARKKSGTRGTKEKPGRRNVRARAKLLTLWLPVGCSGASFHAGLFVWHDFNQIGYVAAQGLAYQIDVVYADTGSHLVI